MPPDGTSMTAAMANGLGIALGLDGSTTYHQEVVARTSDVREGATVQVQLGNGFGPGQVTRTSGGSITLGAAGDVPVVP